VGVTFVGKECYFQIVKVTRTTFDTTMGKLVHFSPNRICRHPVA
jgi:hypothetical protein